MCEFNGLPLYLACGLSPLSPQYAYAAEVYEKLEDRKALIALYVETHQWENVSLRT